LVNKRDGKLFYEQYDDYRSVHAIPQFSTLTTETVCKLNASYSTHSNLPVAPIVLKPFIIIPSCCSY